MRPSAFVMRPTSLLITVASAGIVLQTLHAQAQWWSHQPADFEECADAAEKAATKEAKASAMIACNAKFAGRRKPGGGYTYYDFMQGRSFDIAGPNPTPEEQKKIDESYTAYLDRERQRRVAAALAAKRQQQQVLQYQPTPLQQQASLRHESLRHEKVPLPAAAPHKPPAAESFWRSRPKAGCANHTFSCEWPRLSESINNFWKRLSAPQGKAKRG
jgi:hypothetical protein